MTLPKRTVSAVKGNAILAVCVCHSVSLKLNHGAQASGANCSYYLRVLQESRDIYSVFDLPCYALYAVCQNWSKLHSVLSAESANEIVYTQIWRSELIDRGQSRNIAEEYRPFSTTHNGSHSVFFYHRCDPSHPKHQLIWMQESH